MADDKIKIEIDVETRSAIADLAKLAKATEQVEKQTEKLTAAQRAWKLANTDIGKLAGGWKEAGESIAKVATAFGGLAVAGVAVAAAAERQENALRRLGSAYDAVSVATNGAFSAQQALTLQGQIQAAGVRVNAEQLGLLTRAAREYALATGNDASEAVEKLTNAIVNNSEDALSELNLAQARATTSTQTLANVTRALEERFRGVAPAARTLNEDLAKLPDVLTYIGNAAAQAAGGGIARFIDAINGAGTAARTWRDIVELADTGRQNARQQRTDANYRGLQDRRQQMLSRLNAAGVEIPESLRGQLGRGLNNASDSELGALGRALEQSQRQRGRGAGVLPALPSDSAGFDAGFDSVRAIGEASNDSRYAFARAAREAFGLMNAATADEARKREPATARGVRALDELKIKLNETTAAVQQAGESLASFKNRLDRSKPGESVDALFEFYRGDQFRQQNAFEIDADRSAASLATALGINGTDGLDLDAIANGMEGGGLMAREERARRSRIATRNQGTRRMAREQSLGGRVAGSLGFGTDAEGRISPFDGMQAGAELLTGTVNSLTSGLTSLFDTLVSGSADAGTAFQAFASGLLTELGKMAVNKGLFYTFEGIAALFSAPPAAPAYFAAGAGLLALGAGLGIAGAATRPQTPAPGADVSTARGLAPRSSNSGASTRDLAPVTVVMSSLVPAGPNDARRVRSGLDDARRRGFAGNNAPRRVEY